MQRQNLPMLHPQHPPNTLLIPYKLQWCAIYCVMHSLHSKWAHGGRRRPLAGGGGGGGGGVHGVHHEQMRALEAGQLFYHHSLAPPLAFEQPGQPASRRPTTFDKGLADRAPPGPRANVQPRQRPALGPAVPARLQRAARGARELAGPCLRARPLRDACRRPRDSSAPIGHADSPPPPTAQPAALAPPPPPPQRRRQPPSPHFSPRRRSPRPATPRSRRWATRTAMRCPWSWASPARRTCASSWPTGRSPRQHPPPPPPRPPNHLCPPLWPWTKRCAAAKAVCSASAVHTDACTDGDTGWPSGAAC